MAKDEQYYNITIYYNMITVINTVATVAQPNITPGLQQCIDSLHEGGK